MPSLPNTSIYFLRDRFPLGGDPRYDYNDFTFVLQQAWHNEGALGITPHFQINRPYPEAALDGIQKWQSG